MLEAKENIYYYLNNERYAFRSRYHVPRAGDEVRLSGTCYKVMLVVWVEDQKKPYDHHVAIALEPPKKSAAKKKRSTKKGQP
jgi:hypothetical protein